MPRRTSRPASASPTRASSDWSKLTRAESGRDEVFATTYPEPTGRWQVSRDGGAWARWRADGREIYFTTRDRIMAVAVSTEGGLTLGRPRELFTRPTTDWNPTWFDGVAVTADGQRLISGGMA